MRSYNHHELYTAKHRSKNLTRTNTASSSAEAHVVPLSLTSFFLIIIRLNSGPRCQIVFVTSESRVHSVTDQRNLSFRHTLDSCILGNAYQGVSWMKHLLPNVTLQGQPMPKSKNQINISQTTAMSGNKLLYSNVNNRCNI